MECSVKETILYNGIFMESGKITTVKGKLNKGYGFLTNMAIKTVFFVFLSLVYIL